MELHQLSKCHVIGCHRVLDIFKVPGEVLGGMLAKAYNTHEGPSGLLCTILIPKLYYFHCPLLNRSLSLHKCRISGVRKNVSLSSLSSNLSNLWIRSEKIIHFRLGIKIVVKVFFLQEDLKYFFC